MASLERGQATPEELARQNIDTLLVQSDAITFC